MNVLKFGGTSVGSVSRIKHVAELVLERGRNIVVLSAMSGTTNTLVDICEYLEKDNRDGALETLNALKTKYDGVIAELFAVPEGASDNETERTEEARIEAKTTIDRILGMIRSITALDYNDNYGKEILAQGELISTSLFHLYLLNRGIRSVLLPALEFMRIDEEAEPDMRFITTHLQMLLDQQRDADIYLTQGYVCRNAEGRVDNLRRGGSDYTASLIGAAIGAGEIQIWTDIDGMHNNDPRYVEGTRPVSELHFDEAAELAYFGAKILHPSCVLPARLANIPVRLLNTLEPEKPGTLIHNVQQSGSIKAVAAKDNVTAVKIKSGRMLVAYGFLQKIFDIFARHRTSIDMMATSEVSVTVTVDNSERLADIVDDLKHFGTVTIDTDMTIICVVGDLNWHNRQLEAHAVNALSGIPIRMISYGGSDYNISMLINSEDKVRALQALSAALF